MARMNATVKKLLASEVAARDSWYATHKGASPRRPYSQPQRDALRSLEKAKTALTAAVGASSFREAAKALNYKPRYATRPLA